MRARIPPIFVHDRVGRHNVERITKRAAVDQLNRSVAQLRAERIRCAVMLSIVALAWAQKLQRRRSAWAAHVEMRRDRSARG